MNVVTMISLVILVFGIIYNVHVGATKNSMNESEIDNHSATNVGFLIVMFLFMFFGGWAIETHEIGNTREKYEEIMLNGNWEIRTKTSLIVKNGDTIRNEVTRYVYILKDNE
jgi:hypothetical protein